MNNPIIQTYNTDAVKKRLDNMILFHACVAGAAGLIPAPGVTAIVNAGNQILMYKKINEITGVRFSKRAIRCIAKIIVSQTAGFGSALGGILLAEALKCLPGVGTVAGTALEVAAGPLSTYICGCVYCRALGNLIDAGREVSESMMKEAVAEVCKDKEFVRQKRKEGKAKLRGANYANFAAQAQNVAKGEEK